MTMRGATPFLLSRCLVPAVAAGVNLRTRQRGEVQPYERAVVPTEVVR